MYINGVGGYFSMAQVMKKKKNAKLKPVMYITAYDPVIKKRVLHIVENGFAISTITGNKFKYVKK